MTAIKSKQILFENIFNHEQVYCKDPNDIHRIDGIEYVLVRRAGQDRQLLMRKDALKKVKQK